MFDEQNSFTNKQTGLSIVMLVHQVYNYVSEVYNTPELEQKRRAMHAIVDEVCDEINGSIERLEE